MTLLKQEAIMQLLDSDKRFGLVSIANHWFAALLIIGMLSLGLYMADLPKGPWKGQLFAIHKSFGVLVLMLGAARIGWRLGNSLPGPVDTTRPWLRKTARQLHLLLMAMMLALPLSGWAMSSAGDHPVSFFGLFTLPPLLAADKDLAKILVNVHAALAWTLIALLVLHAGAALQHHFIARDATLRRMLGRPS
jgi:cytochrome b561